MSSLHEADGPPLIAELRAPLRGAGIELLAPLGAGSSSTVYRARTIRRWRGVRGGTTVAVKVLHRDLAGDTHAVAQIRREGQLGMRVRSPHVARIFGADVTPGPVGLTFLVMELVEGHTLRQFLAGAAPAVEDLARRIGLDAARGLAALHRLGIVHRDVKPENLALTPDGRVVVVDLGLARQRQGTADGAPSSGGFFGSLGYAAPEVLAGAPAGPSSDLYALGLVLFEVATGRHPFHDAATPDAMLHAHLHREPPRVSHLRPRVSAFLERLIGELLAKDAAHRPARADDVVEALAQGESSRYWETREREQPMLASRRRLQALRRFAPTRLIGRRGERRRLDDLFRQVTAGGGAAIALTGARGIGRRRLLDECIEGWLRVRHDMVFLGGRAERAEHQGGAPFPEMLLDWFLRGDDADSPQVAPRLAARIRAETRLLDRDATRLAELVSRTGADEPPEVRADLLARGLLEIAHGGRPLVIRIESAGRLSTTGRLVLARLLDALERRPVLLLLVTGTGRSLPKRIPRLRLEGLPEQEFVELGDALFAPGEAPREVVRRAHPVLGGSPGTLLAALDDLAARGVLAGRGGQWQLARELDELRPPASLLSWLRARVRLLPDDVSFVWKAAAVLADRFPIADLQALTGRSELEVLEALSAFGGRVAGAERGRAFFHHRDYRRALLGTIPAGARQRLHRLAAWILEERGAPALQVGMHWSRAGEHRAAVEPLLHGLDRLVRAGSRRAALRVAERLRLHLDALERNERFDGWRLRHHLLAARALEQAGHAARAARAYRRAARLGAELGQRAALADALVGLAELACRDGDLRRAQRLVLRAERAAAGAGDESARTSAARALALRARIAADLGEADDSPQRLSDLAAALPREHELRPALLLELARHQALRTRFVAAAKTFARAQRGFARSGEGRGLMRAQLGLAEVRAQTGDDDGAAQALEQALARARELAETRASAEASLALGDLAARRGDRSAATSLWFDALAGATAARDRPLRTAAAIQLARHGVPIGDVERAVDELELPALRTAWLLAQAERAAAPAEAEAAAERAAALASRHLLPLYLRLRALRAAGRGTRADAIASAVASRLPAAQRRRFLQRAAEP